MTTGTAPLIDRKRDEVESAADAATIAGLRKDMLDHLTRRVAEQMTENKALREVAQMAEWSYLCANTCPLCYADKGYGHAADCPYSDLYAAGYLPVEESEHETV